MKDASDLSLRLTRTGGGKPPGHILNGCHPDGGRGYADGMTDVVDSDELLRRIRRARACAAQEERAWRARGDELGRAESADPGAARDAEVREVAYGVVLRVLDEILTPGRHTARS